MPGSATRSTASSYRAVPPPHPVINPCTSPGLCAATSLGCVLPSPFLCFKQYIINPLLCSLSTQRPPLVPLLPQVSLPTFGQGLPAYYVLALSEASSNLSRYDSVRYGARSPAATDLASLFAGSRAEGLGGEVKRRILMGTYALSAGYYDAYYKRAQQVCAGGGGGQRRGSERGGGESAACGAA